MLFRRRSELTTWERFRLSLWPRVSWRRSGSYHAKRLLRLSGSPYAVAMGCAVGAFVSITPFLGFHFIIAIAIAWVLRSNLLAAAIGTGLGNPLTYPIYWATTFELGRYILPGPQQDVPAGLEHDLWHKSLGQLWPVIEPMIIGSIPIGLPVGAIVYVAVYKMVAAYQSARRARLARKRFDIGVSTGTTP
jgi:uncharacterized protein (DUF2062 family)